MSSHIRKQMALSQYEKLVMKGGKISLKGTPAEKEKLARGILRYAFTELLGWGPKEVREHMTLALLQRLRLDALEKYLVFPPDVDRKTDMDYYAYLAFPESGFDNTRQVLRAYRRILAGEDAGFRKNFFKGPGGYQKATILLREFISSNITANSTADLYRLFANTKVITAKLRKARLYTTVNRLYESPLDCLHFSLPEEEQDEFLYNAYSYLLAYWGDKSFREPREKAKKEEAV